MSSGQPSFSAVGRSSFAHSTTHSRGPAKWARKPSFNIKREEIKREISPEKGGEDAGRASVAAEDAQLLLGFHSGSPVNTQSTTPTALSRLSISSLVNPHDVPISARPSNASPASAPPQTTAFSSPPIHHLRARSASPAPPPALDLPTLPLATRSRVLEGSVDSSRATKSMSISVEPEPMTVPEETVEASGSGSKPRLPRIPKKNGYRSPAKVPSTSLPEMPASITSPGKTSSTLSPRKVSSSTQNESSSSNKTTGSPGKSAVSTTSSKPTSTSPAKSSSSTATRKPTLLVSPPSSPLKPRGRVSKGPKKREGPGWIIESCTTSGAASDNDGDDPSSSPPPSVIAAKLEEVFGGDSDLSDLSGSEDEEEYDPGLAGLPALPLSSESEYEPLAGRFRQEGVLRRRPDRSPGVPYSDFQSSIRTSVRLVQRSAGSPSKSEVEVEGDADKPDETNNQGSGSVVRGRGKGRGRGGRGRGGRSVSVSRESAGPSDGEGEEQEEQEEQEEGQEEIDVVGLEGPKRGSDRRARGRGRGQDPRGSSVTQPKTRRARSQPPRSTSTRVLRSASRAPESEVESEEEQLGPRQRVRRSSSQPPESDSESEPEPEPAPEVKRGGRGGSRARGTRRGTGRTTTSTSGPPPVAESTSTPAIRARRARGGRGRAIVAAPMSTTSSISLGGNYNISASSVLESVASADSALGPRLRKRAVQARNSGSSSLTDLTGTGSASSPSLGGTTQLVDSPSLGGAASLISESLAGTCISETTGAGEIVVVEMKSPGKVIERDFADFVDVESVSPVRGGRVSPSRRDQKSPSRRERESPNRRERESPSRRDQVSPSRRDREFPSRRDRESTQHRDKRSDPQRRSKSPVSTKKVMEVVIPSRQKSKHRSAIATHAKLVHPDSSRSPENVLILLPETTVFHHSRDEDEGREVAKSRRRTRTEKDRDSPSKRSRVDKGKGKAIVDETEMDHEMAKPAGSSRRTSRRQSRPTTRARQSAEQEQEGDDIEDPALQVALQRSRSASSLTVSEKSISLGPSASMSGKKSAKRRREEPEERSNASKRRRASTEVESIQSKSSQDKAPMVQLRQGDFVLRLQDKRCFHYSLDQTVVPRCLACRKKQAGDTCRFFNIRYFKLTPTACDAIGVSFDSPQFVEQPDFHLPPVWNITPEITHVDRIRGVIARALRPVLDEELKHAMKPNAIWRPVEIEVRATCDVCATSMFASCHMCTWCGRELCGECYRQVEDMCPAGTPTQYNKGQRKDQQLHKYRACTGLSTFHVPSNFRPITRFIRKDLEEILKDMNSTIRDGTPAPPVSRPGSSRISSWASRVPPWNPTSPQASTEPPALSETGSSHDVSSLRGTPDPQLASMPIIASPTMSPTHEDGFTTEVGVAAGKRPAAPHSGYADPAGLPSHTVQYFPKEITEETFKPIWAKGEALVVGGLLDGFKINWTPEYFIQEYGEQECFVVDCKTDKSTLSTVEEFFDQFNDPDREESILKLKDWPAQADFRDDFPDLFMDFMNALPIPNYTRRDGILNVASHFAINAIAPDLGPKMYNAFASNEGPGGQGSTRLHMDMADAVNIMMYANDCRDGRPGTAAWDIFKASDSDRIRAYLRRHFDSKAVQYRDPIHSQLFYLDSEHRRRLYEEEKVYSWRIYQRPGDAVFIPAGCAHQVCNLADCIKVAIDFVSLENIDRCEKLTAEFRNENDTFTWKEDVLQLRTMMMYAWHSAAQLRKAWEDRSVVAEA